MEFLMKMSKSKNTKTKKTNKNYFFISCTSNIGFLHLNRFNVLPLDHNTDLTQIAIARCSLAFRVGRRKVLRTFFIQLHNFLGSDSVPAAEPGSGFFILILYLI